MSPRHVALLAALSAVWGGSYLLIKYGLEDLEPAVIVWVRLVLAAIVLYGVMWARGGGAEARAAQAVQGAPQVAPRRRLVEVTPEQLGQARSRRRPLDREIDEQRQRLANCQDPLVLALQHARDAEQHEPRRQGVDHGRGS